MGVSSSTISAAKDSSVNLSLNWTDEIRDTDVSQVVSFRAKEGFFTLQCSRSKFA